jgi:hypothetical protein
LDPKETSDEDLQKTIEAANANHSKFVLKPQREGGGNNIYNEVSTQYMLDNDYTSSVYLIPLNMLIRHITFLHVDRTFLLHLSPCPRTN